ncbi:hypothetical protein HETIRDRAFT_53756 [Heterobasidion irregulare TC 32-1]|uniref:Guanylate-binding protein N-terminal domain-containing protein n=1 Tax=Heterobasidion irregulare (strain TC 32-1) TaxID=747525 RepID=W4JS09_HETIT|nr:uncharacterized protein HETIRDRAFT_53756 [Heterobasidion irregulare TC 32-1]ETW76254.1 hypothetical protein HETIRDRAFT_53756 [Heterobasidion irregulare TC 32-1]
MRVPERDQVNTTNNCLIDCHLDVWTRFPVQAAIRRENISHLGRSRQSITFLTDNPEAPFAAYFHGLIRSFQDHVHKPTGGVLSEIKVCALRHADFSFQDLAVSLFSAGEWVVELLCLIPLHLAVTRQNRFIPLKDGVWTPEYERELLGADVGQIVDALSLGWYESLFQSYMVSKPVRVVSSMGEQSVGKSYSLNHFVDTSFAGSAMRTTEGVWMSVTPTHDALVVALDFEGVHSIERSPQEDALLVLFNTAISNLVLFRNNFALSRNISGLFTSFQSSSSILDPASNPGIFNGTLCIIIRDVVDTDARDIINEFSLKFRKIVEDEKEDNFISRLHRGRISIIPWPVINTHRFFNLFGSLKKRFERQGVTYTSAGVFLHTLKTLMAKLKANDWGALDQTLASHRARVLTSSLRGALSRGLMEPDCEPLKALTHHLSGLIETRITLVRDWLSANTSRFKDFDDVQRLRRTADIAYLDVLASVQVCSMQCLNCSLACIRPKNHPLDHMCGTSHRCWRQCEISEQHSSPKDCGLP